MTRTLSIPIPGAGSVSGLAIDPAGASAVLALAHGAGAGMGHPFMQAMAEGLGHRGIATLRFQFPYMEAQKKRPDHRAVLERTWQAAITAASDLARQRPLFLGGKSMGGRIASHVAATPAGAGIAGLVFFGFPLHPAGRPDTTRALHLAAVTAPMLFIQGTRDALADLPLTREVTAALGPRVTLHIIDDGDHSFAVRKRSGRTTSEAWTEALDTAAVWMHRTAESPQKNPSRVSFEHAGASNTQEGMMPKKGTPKRTTAKTSPAKSSPKTGTSRATTPKRSAPQAGAKAAKAPATTARTGAKKVARPTLIDLNKATEGQLAKLSSIGSDRAKKIVAYRKSHGDFTRIEDLTRVGGFGRRLKDDLKNSLKV